MTENIRAEQGTDVWTVQTLTTIEGRDPEAGLYVRSSWAGVREALTDVAEELSGIEEVRDDGDADDIPPAEEDLAGFLEILLALDVGEHYDVRVGSPEGQLVSVDVVLHTVGL